MKYLLLTFALLTCCAHAYADHVLGGELLYTHLSDNTYRMTLTIYADCSGGSFSHLQNAAPRIHVFNGAASLNTLILEEELNKRIEVSNVCAKDAPYTTCKSPSGTVPGVMRFVYSGTIDLPPSANWRFLFAGHMDTSGKSQSGLSHNISNIITNSGFGQHMYLEATLDNTAGPNSSPRYSVVPTPYYCINQQNEYTQGAVDTDRDRLKFLMSPPVDLNGIITKYTPPLNYANPMVVHPGGFTYNELNGQMRFNPSGIQVPMIVNKVEEYRNGKLVGSSMRVMTFFIIGNCSNEAPYGDIDPATVHGGTLHNNAVYVCGDEHQVEFDVPVLDNNNDNIEVLVTNLPPGAGIWVKDNGTKKPTIHFSWNLINVQPGVYTMYARCTDGACPMPGNRTMSFSVIVANPFTISHEVLQPTNCKYKQHIALHIGEGITPRRITVTDDANNTIKTYIDETGLVKDSFATGNYKVRVQADHLPCDTLYSFSVTDNGVYPDPPILGDIHQCIGENPTELKPQPAGGGIVRWYDMDGNILPQPPVYTTDTVKHLQWLINQRVKVCESVFDTVHVSVHPYPDISITSKGGHACVGDGIYLYPAGGVHYDWQPADKIEQNGDTPFVYIKEPVTFIVTGYSEYNCAAKDTIVFDDIEPCCLFSYPTAFTPNNDGTNDGWHPITYGNVDYYLLSVYNRWGERIYTSSDPKQRWDGNHAGKPCDVGTYHFLLKANCITGQHVQQGGSFVLVR